jgi:hypothetical protein
VPTLYLSSRVSSFMQGSAVPRSVVEILGLRLVQGHTDEPLNPMRNEFPIVPKIMARLLVCGDGDHGEKCNIPGYRS